MTLPDRINAAVARSAVGRWFRLEDSGHARARAGTRFLTEIRAGLATFFAMSYIISVNSTIISQSGGPCVCPNWDKAGSRPVDRPEARADPLCDADPAYLLCVQEVGRDVVTATAAIAALATFFIGLLANLPIGLAPGMGVNAYFAYSIVGYHGSRPLRYETALAVVFVEGLAFLVLSIVGLRQWLIRAIPRSIKLATGVGIGMYLTLIGLTYSAGIGAVVGAHSTPLELAGCTPDRLDPVTGLCPSSVKMRNPTMWIGIFLGGILTAVLVMYRFKGAIIAGILLVSIVSWPRGTPVTFFPDSPVGDARFEFFKKVVVLNPIRHTLNVLDWNLSENGSQVVIAFFTLLYVDILDVTGTLYSMASFAKLTDPATQDFEGSSAAYIVDALAISIGSLLGVSPVVTFVESGAGISEGGRTGLTAIVVSLCFAVSVFFAPIFASIPPWATGCTLVLVGCLMAKSVTDINWRYLGDSIPAFLTIVLMPFTYSIAYGLIGGIAAYALINGLVWAVAAASAGRAVPENYDLMEPWSARGAGPGRGIASILPPWLVRLGRGQWAFWRESPAEQGAGVGGGGGAAVGAAVARSANGDGGGGRGDGPLGLGEKGGPDPADDEVERGSTALDLELDLPHHKHHHHHHRHDDEDDKHRPAGTGGGVGTSASTEALREAIAEIGKDEDDHQHDHHRKTEKDDDDDDDDDDDRDPPSTGSTNGYGVDVNVPPAGAGRRG